MQRQTLRQRQRYRQRVKNRPMSGEYLIFAVDDSGLEALLVEDLTVARLNLNLSFDR